MKLMVNHQTHYRYTQVARNSVQLQLRDMNIAT